MTEPSQEAKEAAAKIEQHAADIEDAIVSEETYASIVQQAIAAASAKLREENDKLKRDILKLLPLVPARYFPLGITLSSRNVPSMSKGEGGAQQQRKEVIT